MLSLLPLASFYPEMALFRNLGVNPPEADKSAGFLVPALRRDAQYLDFLDLAENCSFVNWKLKLLPIIASFHFWMGTSEGPAWRTGYKKGRKIL